MRSLFARCLLLAMALLGAGCNYFPQWQPTETLIPGDRVVFPLTFYSGQPFVRISLDGRDYLAMIDTGSPDLTLSPEFAKKLKYSQHLSVPTVSTDGSGVSRWFWTSNTIKEFTMGDVRFRDLDAGIVDMSHIYPSSEPPLVAIAGLYLFHDCLLTIDYPGNRMILERGELPPANGRDILDYRWSLEGQLEIEATVAGKRMWAKIDTGYYCALSVSSTDRSIPFEKPPEDGGPLTSLFTTTGRDMDAKLAGTLIFGNYVFMHPDVTISRPRDDVLIGNRILGRFQITIDQKNRRIRLAEGPPVGFLRR